MPLVGRWQNLLSYRSFRFEGSVAYTSMLGFFEIRKGSTAPSTRRPGALVFEPAPSIWVIKSLVLVSRRHIGGGQLELLQSRDRSGVICDISKNLYSAGRANHTQVREISEWCRKRERKENWRV